MNSIKATRSTREIWQSLCSADPTCTFYQTPHWLEIAVQYLAHPNRGSQIVEVYPWQFETETGPVVLPLLRRRKWNAWHYFSPFGTYAALLTAHPLSTTTLNAIAKRMARENVYLISSPFTPNVFTVGKILPYEIQVIDLAQLNPQEPMRDWDEGQRRRVRVAEKNQVLIRPAETKKDWEAYEALYRSSLARWGDSVTTVYDADLFQSLRQRLQGHPELTLWLAEVGGEIGAGYLTFYHNQHIVPWHGAAEKKFFALGVTQALFLRIIREGIARGFSTFDLTGSGNLAGVQDFKARFGAKKITFNSSLNQVGWYGFASQLRHLIRQSS